MAAILNFLDQFFWKSNQHANTTLHLYFKFHVNPWSGSRDRVHTNFIKLANEPNENLTFLIYCFCIMTIVLVRKSYVKNFLRYHPFHSRRTQTWWMSPVYRIWQGIIYPDHWYIHYEFLLINILLWNSYWKHKQAGYMVYIIFPQQGV